MSWLLYMLELQSVSSGDSCVAEGEKDGEKSVSLWFLVFKASKIPKGKDFSDDKKRIKNILTEREMEMV